MRPFVPNPNFKRELEHAAAFQASMRVVAEHVQNTAERFGRQAELPWLPRKGAPSSFVVAQQDGETAVVSTDHLGHLAEWGSINNPPHAPLRRAARASGLQLK